MTFTPDVVDPYDTDIMHVAAGLAVTAFTNPLQGAFSVFSPKFLLGEG